MAFSITLNGEKIHEVDVDPRLVTDVRLYTAQGEAGVAGSPLTGLGSDSVGIVVNYQQSDTLPMQEDKARHAKEAARLESGQEEVTTYNENARREAALEEVDAEYAEKAKDNPEEDLSAEYQQARAEAVNPAAAPPNPEAAPAKKSEKTPEKAPEKASSK